MNSRKAQVPRVVADYFGPHGQHPIIVEAFTPSRGWWLYGFRKCISRSWARKLRTEGIEAVLLLEPQSGRRADFTIQELLR